MDQAVSEQSRESARRRHEGFLNFAQWDPRHNKWTRRHLPPVGIDEAGEFSIIHRITAWELTYWTDNESLEFYDDIKEYLISGRALAAGLEVDDVNELLENLFPNPNPQQDSQDSQEQQSGLIV